jgi:hypothetical protein
MHSSLAQSQSCVSSSHLSPKFNPTLPPTCRVSVSRRPRVNVTPQRVSHHLLEPPLSPPPPCLLLFSASSFFLGESPSLFCRAAMAARLLKPSCVQAQCEQDDFGIRGGRGRNLKPRTLSPRALRILSAAASSILLLPILAWVGGDTDCWTEPAKVSQSFIISRSNR